MEFSSASKILILGGYAILDPSNKGISISTDIRFKSQIQIKPIQEKTIIKINSISINQNWVYTIDDNFNINYQDNPFLNASLKLFYEYLIHIKYQKQHYEIEITLQNDNGFYSKNGKKTGLGSSSCVIVNIIGILMKAYNIFDIKILHILCQKANMVAQNKIGSGFDIQTSIYGTHVFQRQNIDWNNFQFDINLNDEKIQKIKFNQDIKIFLLDIQTGSDTRILVKNVTKYFENNQQDKMNFYNQTNKLCQNFIENVENFEKLKQINQEYRNVIQNLSQLTKVEIEPQKFTLIFDKLIQQFQQIFYIICPGAGGYDAACILSQQVFKYLKGSNV